MAALKEEKIEEKQDVNKKENKNNNDNNECNVKLVVYDFDQTITTFHLYHELSEDDGEGQVDALAKRQEEDKDFLINIFGGKDRLEAIDKHFKILTDNNIELAIISYGYVQVIKNALAAPSIKLYKKYFKNSKIIGNDSIELQEYPVNGNKAKCIQRQFQQYSSKEIIFVDDDKYNIQDASENKRDGKDAVCYTVLIEPRQGMNNTHMQTIETIAGIKRNIANNDK